MRERAHAARENVPAQSRGTASFPSAAFTPISANETTLNV